MKRSEAYAYRRKIELAAETQTDEQAVESIDLYPKWMPQIQIVKDKRYQYNGVLYKAIQSHTSQADWTPDKVPALFVKVSLEEWPEWVQPTGAHDAYNKGDKVAHNGKHWESGYDGNVWEPGVFGWTEV